MTTVYDVIVQEGPGQRARVLVTVATAELAEDQAAELRAREEDRPWLAWWQSREEADAK